MNKKYTLFSFLSIIICLVFIFSCVKDEVIIKQTEAFAPIVIKGFIVPGAKTLIEEEDISVVLPIGTDISAITPEIILANNTFTVLPKSKEKVNFSLQNPMKYTVTSKNGVTRDFFVKIIFSENAIQSNDNFIRSFIVSGINGIIDYVKGAEITVSLPNNYSLKVSPVIQIGAEASISPTSASEVDFSDGQRKKYIVTAKDGSTREYMVLVKRGTEGGGNLSSEKDIIGFSIPGGITTVEIPDRVIYITVPFTRNFKFKPVINISDKATVFPANGVEVDFNPANTVLYLVTAEDGSVNEYRVRFNVLPEPIFAKDLVSFTIDGQIGTTVIDQIAKTVKITLPAGYLLTNSKPNITTTPGSTISPASGLIKDFSSPITYTVKNSTDLSTKNYKVTVVKQSEACASDIALLVDGTKHYELVKNNKTWDEANSCATKRGGYLVNINSGEENAKVLDLATGNILNLDVTNTSEEGINVTNNKPHIWLGGYETGNILDSNNFQWTQDSDIFFNSRLLGLGGAVNGKVEFFAGRIGCENQPDSSFNTSSKVAMSIRDFYTSILCGSTDSRGKWIDAQADNKLYYVIEYNQTIK